MNYKYSKCPICGSREIKEISSTSLGMDIIHEYLCCSCDEKFSSKQLLDKFIKQTNLKEKEDSDRLIKNQQREIDELKKEIEYKPLTAKQVFSKCNDSVLTFNCDFEHMYSKGTAFCITGNKYITNAHVILNTRERKKDISIDEILPRSINSITFEKNFSLDKFDIGLDLAIISIKNSNKKALTLSNTEVSVGDVVYAIGNPKGEGISIAEGIVSDNHRKIGNIDYVMFTGAINSGNSGGPLLNDNGEVIGVVTASRNEAIGMNYALPIKYIRLMIGD